ncbi:MAG: cadherin domain-containing protein [Hydrogenophilales bacterium]|nr:cadherin domain-containing protein [Hydrogenophilales bacterium]
MPRNHEVPTDAGADNVYDVTVQVSDGDGGTDTQAIAVSVSDVNEAPEVTVPGAQTVNEDTPLSIPGITVNDPDGNLADVQLSVQYGTLTVDLSGGATLGAGANGSAAMTLSGSQAQINDALASLSYQGSPDFNGLDALNLLAGDGVLSTSRSVSINVLSVNDAPVIVSDGGGASATINVAENDAAVTVVAATDVDLPAQTLTYSIVGGADAAKFQIDASTGVLSFLAAPDYEAPTDANADNVYLVTIGAADGTLDDTQDLSVAVNPVNDNAPIITSGSGGASTSVSVDENTLAVMVVTASDADQPPQTMIYSIVGGADAARFQIDASTGTLAFIVAPDYELPTDTGGNNVYDLTVQVSDGNGLVDTQTISVLVTAVNDNAPVITSDGGGASAALSVAENTAGVTTVVAGDADLPTQTLSYSIVGGADAARFQIDANTGVLSFVAAPGYDAPADVGGDNVSDGVAQVSDGSLTATQSIAVTATSVNASAPAITSNGGGATAAIPIPENTAAVTTVTAMDDDLPAQTLTYSISGGADAPLFQIDAVSGALSFIAAPDYETPNDTGGNNVYNVTVQVSDGNGGTDSQAIAVTVTPVNDNVQVLDPIGDRTVTEGNVLTFTATATDADVPPDSLTYSFSGEPTGASITAGGVFTWTPNEAQGPNTYSFDVIVSDGQGGSDFETIQVTVNEGTNQAPVLSSIGDRTVTEGNVLTFTATATDTDIPPDTLTYSLVAPPRALSSPPVVFSLDPTEAQGPGSYTFDVLVSDGQGGTDSETIQVTVSEGANQPPVLDAIGNQSVAEGQALTFIATATDADVPPGVLSYSLNNAPAGASITTGGVFTWTPSEAQGPNTYTFDVIVSDGQGGSDSETIQITVTEGNGDPVITSDGGGDSASLNLAEGTTAVTVVTATDADQPAQALTYSISGGADAALFQIDADTGVLSFITAPDYEHPADAGVDNVYTVTVQASDGNGGTDSQAITVTVTNKNEAAVGPVEDVDDAPNRVMEDAGQGTAVGIVAQARDADNADMVRYSLSDNAGGRFTIDPVSGVVSVAEPLLLDFETVQSHTISVRASSSDGSSSTLAMVVEVGNANDLAPELTLSLISLTQGETVALDGDVFDARDPDGLDDSLSFSIGNVVAGHFESISAPGVPIGRFEQSELLAGQVRFVHDGSDVAPAFEVSVSDDRYTTGPSSALIRFDFIDTPAPDGPPDIPVPDDPDTTPPTDGDGPAPGDTDAPVDPGAQPGGEDAVSEYLPNPPKVESLQDALLEYDTAAARTISPSIQASVADASVVLARIGANSDLSPAPVGFLEQYRLILSGYAQTDAGQGSLAERFDAPALPQLAEEAQAQTFEILRDTARLAGIAFSVGAVWWAIRIGGLMASLIATLPAWRQFDPLPILRHKAELDDTGKWLEEDIATEAHAPERNGAVPDNDKVSAS